jgi:apolipoprotein N-acyltransferase
VRGIFLRGIAVWALIVLVESIHGTLRVLLLQPQVGELRSRQIGFVTGSLLILAIATLTVKWLGARRRRELGLVGLIWLVLILAFELLVGRFAAGFSWDRIAADYDPRRGGLMAFGLLLVAAAPLLAARFRRLRPERSR